MNKPGARLSLALHSGWKFRDADSGKWLEAIVPGCIHSDLRRHELIPDPFWGSNELELQWIGERAWTYQTSFELPADWLRHEVIELVAESLDTLATVTLNGEIIGRSESMFVCSRWAIGAQLRAGVNELRIEFAPVAPYIKEHLPKDHPREWNDYVGGASAVRKEQCQFGWDWGPRFLTCGIVRPLRIEAWSGNRIESLRVTQTHSAGAVTLEVAPQLARPGDERCRSRLLLAGKVVAESTSASLTVPDPQLWWTNGLGDQPLYDLEVELLASEQVIDHALRRIGLRTIELDRHADEWGESFQFKINGRPIFAKGANWIPAHSFPSELGRDDYDRLLTSAAEAHMNMLRVWGGGIYEAEEFYDLCDERGLLVWQDFMFACALYPGDAHFLSLVATEARDQVQRLAHRACLALWCGNNEIEMMATEIRKTEARQQAYEEVFYGILPRAVEQWDGVTPYWPSSPHNPDGYEKGHNNETAGDCHFWDVWHARFPVKRYEEKTFRFCSEFGMQSYSSVEIAETFCAREEMNVFGLAMENHQKNPAGNQIIMDYISRRYRFPKDYPTLAYLSQVNQAFCMKTGVEHFRRLMPRCMGALYWQLNDCWPVFSWSSLEFGGKWKALQYEARRFFAPVLVSAHVPGDEKPGICNHFESTIDEMHFYTVSDDPAPRRATLRWTLYHLESGPLREGAKEVALESGESVLQIKESFGAEMKSHGAGNLVVRAWLESGPTVLSQATVFLTAPRFMALPQGALDHTLRRLEPGVFEVEWRSDVFHHAVCCDLPASRFHAEDDYFDLFPRIPHRVRVRARPGAEEGELRAALARAFSLAGSFA